MYARKSESQKTPNTMIYGELGRYPLYINTVIKAVTYWLKLVELPDNRQPKAAYETVQSLDDKGVKTWASDRTCLFQYSFGIVWVSQLVGNKTGFLRELKQRLINCNTQDWHNKISTKESFKITEALNKSYNSRATFHMSRSKDTGTP